MACSGVVRGYLFSVDFPLEWEGSLCSIPWAKALHYRLHLGWKAFALKSPIRQKRKSFTWGSGTHPWSPNAIQAENSISVKKYLPTGKTLSTVCFKTKGEENKRCPHSWLGISSFAAHCSEQSLWGGCQELPLTPKLHSASSVYNYPISCFFQKSIKLSSTPGPFPSLPPGAPYQLGDFGMNAGWKPGLSHPALGPHCQSLVSQSFMLLVTDFSAAPGETQFLKPTHPSSDMVLLWV